jgi:hypothetical protein
VSLQPFCQNTTSADKGADPRSLRSRITRYARSWNRISRWETRCLG